MSEEQDSDPATQECSKCGEVKPLDRFGHRNGGRYRRKQCRECVNLAIKAWREKNREPYLEARRAHWHRNKDELNAARRTQEKRDRANELRRQNWAKDPERYRKAARDYRSRNPEKVRSWHRAWYEKYGDEWYPKYRLKYPERVRDMNSRRRAATKDADAATVAHIAQIIVLPCVYCGSCENIEVDHVVPLSRGGKHEIQNLVPACQSCNRSKHNKLLEEWKGGDPNSLDRRST